MCVDIVIKGQQNPTRLKSQKSSTMKRRRETWNDGYLLTYFRSAHYHRYMLWDAHWVLIHQEYPVSFHLPIHQTLLGSKSITFRPTSGHGGADWTLVTLENDIRIIEKKEVWSQFIQPFTAVLLWLLMIGVEWGPISHRWNNYARLNLFVGSVFTVQVVTSTLTDTINLCFKLVYCRRWSLTPHS